MLVMGSFMNAYNMPYLLYEILGTRRYFKLYSFFLYVLISKNSSFPYTGNFPYEGCQEHPCLFQNVYGIMGFVYSISVQEIQRQRALKENIGQGPQTERIQGKYRRRGGI